MNKKILFIGILVLVFSFIGCDQVTDTDPESVTLSTRDFNPDDSHHVTSSTRGALLSGDDDLIRTVTVNFTITGLAKRAYIVLTDQNGFYSLKTLQFGYNALGSISVSKSPQVEKADSYLNIHILLDPPIGIRSVCVIGKLQLTESDSYSVNVKYLVKGEFDPEALDFGFSDEYNISTNGLIDAVIGLKNEIIPNSETSFENDFVSAWNKAAFHY